MPAGVSGGQLRAQIDFQRRTKRLERASNSEGARPLPRRGPQLARSPAVFPLVTAGLADRQECSTARIARFERGDAGLAKRARCQRDRHRRPRSDATRRTGTRRVEGPPRFAAMTMLVSVLVNATVEMPGRFI